ncbi:MAG: mobile mystery protein A [Bacteroidota bacterium]|nr:mobile mystery protein A [Bacteroidota bacterium]
MKKNKLQIEQLESKMKNYSPAANVAIPPTGWIKAIRLALGMSMQQLANRISITKQSVQEMEKREKGGSISLKSLREAAKALDMKLVYCLVPNDGSLDALIERKSMELASKIVKRTSTTMKLEDQENSNRRIKKAIKERATLIKHEMPKILWD